MGLRLLRLCATFTLLAGLPMAVTAAATENRPTEILVSVVNNANVDEKTILYAEQTASYIYKSAGLSIAWKNCWMAPAPECRRVGDPRHLVLDIEHQARTADSEADGVAFLDDRGNGLYCSVFYDRVLHLHQEVHANQGMILGIVVAHELGHLLLGSHAHSAVGIMRPQLQIKDFWVIEPGVNTFNSREAQRIADRLSTGFARGSRWNTNGLNSPETESFATHRERPQGL